MLIKEMGADLVLVVAALVALCGLQGCSDSGQCPANCKDGCNTTGACSGGCKNGYDSIGDACSSVRPCWGEKCDKPCGHCAPSEICDERTGKCKECNLEYWGPACDKKCPSQCDTAVCNKSNGDCTYGCRNHSMWGPRCDRECGGKCKSCEHAAGCVECQEPSYKVPACNSSCTWSYALATSYLSYNIDGKGDCVTKDLGTQGTWPVKAKGWKWEACTSESACHNTIDVLSLLPLGGGLVEWTAAPGTYVPPSVPGSGTQKIECRLHLQDPDPFDMCRKGAQSETVI